MWSADLNDGTRATERTHKWAEVKGRIVSLSYHYHGVPVSLPLGQSDYTFFRTASADIGSPRVTVESSTISCRTADGAVIRIKFNEKSKSISLETGR